MTRFMRRFIGKRLVSILLFLIFILIPAILYFKYGAWMEAFYQAHCFAFDYFGLTVGAAVITYLWEDRDIVGKWILLYLTQKAKKDARKDEVN